MRVILSFIIIIAIILLSLALVVGAALGIGWLLTFFLPFTLFEATLLGLIASVIVGTFWNNILNIIPPFGTRYDPDFDDDGFYYDEDEDEYDTIPPSRFYKTEAQKNWSNWLRYTLANRIYMEFQDWPQTFTMIKDQQQQELAIRIADISLSLLKAKTARAKQFKVTMSTLKREMSKIGQQPYHDDILRLAVPSINEELDYHYEDVAMIIRENMWEKPCTLFD